MLRLVRLCAVLSIVGVSAQALACDPNGGYRSGVGIQLGSVFFGFSKHRNAPCPAVFVAPQVLPPVAYYTQPQVVYAQPPPPAASRLFEPAARQRAARGAGEGSSSLSRQSAQLPGAQVHAGRLVEHHHQQR